MNFALPTGTILDFAAGTAPGGFLACDGSAVSRTTYAGLFAVIGTTWGSGDGSTTFNLPDLRGRCTIGAGTGSGLSARTVGTENIGEETHTLSTSEMPSHSHVIHISNAGTGANTSLGNIAVNQPSDSNISWSTDTAGSGSAHNNMQPSAVALKIIKT